MTPDDDPRLIADRAEELGLSCSEQMELERTQPWVRHWSARHSRGAHNLRAWLAAGRPAAQRELLCVHGAPHMVRAVRAIVDGLPEPLAWHLVQTTDIACMIPGAGMTGPRPAPPPNATTCIGITFTEPGLVVHEIAHSWHRDPRMWEGLTTAQIEAVSDAVAELVDVADERDERDEREDLNELAADCLATECGFPVDTADQRDARRRALAR